MSKKKPRTTRTAASKLTSTDALRLAVSDEKFAAALVKDPGKFKAIFNLRDDEIKAIRESVRPGGIRPGLGGPGDLAAAYD